MPTLRTTVILPVFNERPAFLEKAVHGILTQTFTDYELILMDDGSSRDDTIQCLERVKGLDPRIRFHRHANQGLTRTLNVGLGIAGGDIVFRHDSDDWSEPDRFAKQMAYMHDHPEIGLIGSNVEFHQEDGTPLWVSALPLSPGNVLAFFPSGNPFAHGATCFRRSAAFSVGGYRAFCVHAQDYDGFAKT